MGRFGIWELLLIFLIVIVLFGTKRIRSIGSDLGDAIKSFRGAVREEKEEKTGAGTDDARVIEGQVRSKTEAERSKESV